MAFSNLETLCNKENMQQPLNQKDWIKYPTNTLIVYHFAFQGSVKWKTKFNPKLSLAVFVIPCHQDWKIIIFNILHFWDKTTNMFLIYSHFNTDLSWLIVKIGYNIFYSLANNYKVACWPVHAKQVNTRGGQQCPYI